MRSTRRPLLPLGLALPLAAAFAALTGVVLARHGAPLGLDARLHRWVVRVRTQRGTDVATVVTDTGTGLVAYVVAALAGARARWRRSAVLGALAAVVALAVAQRLRQGLAGAVDRPRPPLADRAVHAGGAAFPSGHTTTSALVAALVCWALVRTLPPGRGRTAGCALAALWAGAVGLSRVYLGVHWPSDVLGGWLLASAAALALLGAGGLVSRAWPGPSASRPPGSPAATGRRGARRSR